MAATTTSNSSAIPKNNKVITIIGATGGTGLCLVKQALDSGHKVTALVRDPDKLTASLLSVNCENLTIRKGDVTKYEDVKAALSGNGSTTTATTTDLIISLGGRDKICSEAQPVINKALNDVNPNMRMVRSFIFMFFFTYI